MTYDSTKKRNSTLIVTLLLFSILLSLVPTNVIVAPVVSNKEPVITIVALPPAPEFIPADVTAEPPSKVNDVIVLGEEGGAGNLVLAEVLKMHINEDVLDKNGNIDPFKMNVVNRYGANWYGKTTKESLYEIAKPISRMGMGIDKLPSEIKNSSILTGSELAILASSENIPEKQDSSKRNNKSLEEKHLFAKKLLSEEKFEEAWQILL